MWLTGTCFSYRTGYPGEADRRPCLARWLSRKAVGAEAADPLPQGSSRQVVGSSSAGGPLGGAFRPPRWLFGGGELDQVVSQRD